jgi:hypothetical protein
MLKVCYTDNGPQMSYKDLPSFSLWLEPEEYPLLSNPEVEELAAWLEPKTGTYGLNAEECPLFRAAHLLYFRARGVALPDRYVPISARLGLEDSRLVYYLGRLATPTQVAAELARPQPALSPNHRPGLELLVQTSGESYLGICNLVVRKNYLLINGHLHDRQGKGLLNISIYGGEDRSLQLLEGFRAWLHQQAAETLEELCQDLERFVNVNRLRLLYAYPQLPDNHRIERTWQREDQTWAITEDPDKALWLVGPGLIEKIWPFHKKRLGVLLKAGHLRPDDPSCAFWVVATSGARLPKGVLRTKWAQVHQHGCWLLLKTRQGGVTWLFHDRANKHWQVRQPLPREVMPVIEAGVLSLAALPAPNRIYTPMEYLGCVDGAHYMLGGAAGGRWAIGSADLPERKQIIARGSREELQQRVAREGLTQLVVTHQLVNL